MTRLDVVTGFLGAGKTTLLARYLRWLDRRGDSYCVIENEFGQAGVDGATLARQGALVKEISGGCVCCALKVTLHDMLRSLAGEVDCVVLEPSGLFCGDDLLDVLRSPSLAGAIQPGMWVGVVDPMMISAMTEADIAVLHSECIHAGSLVMSKVQDASGEELAEAERLVARMFTGLDAPVLWSAPWDTYAEDVWFSSLLRQGMVVRTHERRRFDHGAMFQSATLRLAAAYDEGELDRRMRMLYEPACGQVLRVKGSVRAREGGVWRVNCTPGYVALVRDAAEDVPALNIIGRGLRRADIKCVLEGWQ